MSVLAASWSGAPAAELAELAELAPAVAPTCEGCGATVAPDGVCLELGACSHADARATRGASRSTAKYAAPRAWNVRGGVD